MTRTKGSKNKTTTEPATTEQAAPKKTRARAPKAPKLEPQKLDQKQLAKVLKRNSRIVELRAEIAKLELELSVEFEGLRGDIGGESVAVAKPRKPRAPKAPRQLTQEEMFGGEGGDTEEGGEIDY